MNNNTFDKLQFDDLKSIVGEFCVSELGRKLLVSLNPSSNIDVVKKRLKETSEGVCILDTLGHTPLYGISNIDEVINKISKDIIIDASELVSVSEFLRGCRKFKKAMSDKEDYTNYTDTVFVYQIL